MKTTTHCASAAKLHATYTLAACALSAAIAATAPLQAQQVGRTPIAATISTAPAPIVALGRSHIVYELQLVNYGSTPMRVDALNVLDQEQKPLEQLSGARLASRVSMPGQLVARTDAGPTIPVGATAIVFMWTSLQPGVAVPTTLSHQLILSTGNDARRDTLLLAPTSLRIQNSAPIASPVKGGPWIAIRGPANTSGHRLSIVALDGAARIPQRFAVDWGKLGNDGRLFRGDSTKNSAWYSYGDTVYAAAAGRVAIARDGIADNTPFASTPAVIEAHQATGNLISIDIGGGRFAQYAHLKPGSLGVKVGDTVTEGQPIALVGNSGNTLGPHLHFQLGSAAELLQSEGLPYALREFQLVGRVNGLASLLAGTPWVAQPNQPARDVHAESPLENMVVRFGAR